MKYLDEYRDPELAARLLTAIRRTVTRPWTLMEVCGGQTHTLVRSGIDRLLPEGVRLVHRTGLSGVCNATGADRPRTRDRPAAGGHLLLIRRHVARARLARRTSPASGPRAAIVRAVYSPLDAVRVAKTEPRTARSFSSPSASRRPLRRPPSRPSRPGGLALDELFVVGRPRPGAARNGSDPHSARATSSRAFSPPAMSARSLAGVIADAPRRPLPCPDRRDRV